MLSPVIGLWTSRFICVVCSPPSFIVHEVDMWSFALRRSVISSLRRTNPAIAPSAFGRVRGNLSLQHQVMRSFSSMWDEVAQSIGAENSVPETEKHTDLHTESIRESTAPRSHAAAPGTRRFFNNMLADALRTSTGEFFEKYNELKENEGAVFQPDARTLSMILTAHVRRKDPIDIVAWSWNSLTEAQEDSTWPPLKPQLRAYNKYMVALCRDGKGMGNPSQIESLYQQMIEAGVTPDATTLNLRMMGASHSKKGLNVVEQIFEEGVSDYNIAPNGSHYSTLITCSVKTGDLTRAIHWLKEIENTGTFRVARGAFYVLLGGAIRGSSVEACKEVISLLGDRNDLLWDANVKLPNAALTAMLYIAGRNGCTELIQSVYEIGKKWGYGMDERSFHYNRVRAYAHEGDQLTALDALINYETRFVEYDVRNRNLSALAYRMAKGGVQSVDSIYAWLEKRHNSGEPVSVGALNVVLDACANLKDSDRTMATFLEMENTFGIHPNIESANAVLQVCKSNRKTRQLISFYSEMQTKYNIKPNNRSVTLLVYCAASPRSVDVIAPHVEEFMQEQGASISPHVVGVWAWRLRAAKRFDQCRQFLTAVELVRPELATEKTGIMTRSWKDLEEAEAEAQNA